jgi:putative ABC transport system substrate-binding protein
MNIRFFPLRKHRNTKPARCLFFWLALGCFTAIPALSLAQQQTGGVQRVGILSPFNSKADSFRDAIQKRLRELGYVEGSGIILEYRSSQGSADNLPRLAAELVNLKVDVIVTTTAGGVQAAKLATTTIPIVMAGVDDAVGQGLVSNLAKPEANVTGSSWLNTELSAKRVELLKQMLPKMSNFVFLREAAGGASSLMATSAAARTLGLRFLAWEIRSPSELDGVFAAFAQQRIGALMVAQGPMIISQEQRIIEMARKQRLPTIFSWRQAVESGGLMSYGPKPVELYRRAADYVDRILKGTTPDKLPVEQPTSFELVINSKTAQALGIKIPQTLLVMADELIR